MSNNAAGWFIGGAPAPDTVARTFLPRLGNASEGEELVQGADVGELVYISLFSDARADDGDELLSAADGKRDRRGWWAEGLAGDGDRFGSKLWLLVRAKESAETRARARDYAEDALRWLVEDGIAERVDVEILSPELARCGIVVRVYRGDGRAVTLTYPRLWERLNNA